MDYETFIHAKKAEAPDAGFEPPLPLSESLFLFQRAIVAWALRKGRAAIFAAFGLGKTRMQIELARQVCEQTGGRFLIVAPLGVRQEFIRDGEAMGVTVTFIAILELLREGLIEIVQSEPFAPIHVRAGSPRRVTLVVDNDRPEADNRTEP